MAQCMQIVRDLLRQFAVKHSVSPIQVTKVWSKKKIRRDALNTSTKRYEERLDWWTEQTLPKGPTLRIDVYGQMSYVIIITTDAGADVVVLPQSEVARKQRDYLRKKNPKTTTPPKKDETGHAPTIIESHGVQSAPTEVRHQPVPPAPEQARLNSLSMVLRTLARKSGIKLGVMIVLWKNVPGSTRIPLTLLIPPEEKLRRETCTKLGLEFPSWRFWNYYFTFCTTRLGNGQPKTTPVIIPAGQVPARGSTHPS